MEINKSYYQKVSFTWSLIFATIGLLAALLLLALLNSTVLILKFPMSVFVGVIALYGAAAALGNIAGSLFYKLEVQGIGIWLVGIGLAWSSLIIAGLAGSSVEFFSTNANLQDFGNYILAPLFWIMFFGTIPALVLGLAYTKIVKKHLS